MIDKGYADFTGMVCGRAMEMDYLMPLCGGRVWTGTDAVDNALADYDTTSPMQLLAAGEAGIDEYRIYELPAQKSGLEKYLDSFSGAMGRFGGATHEPGSSLMEDPMIEDLMELGANPGLQAKLDPAFRNYNGEQRAAAERLYYRRERYSRP